MHNVLIIDDDRELCLLIKRSVLLEDIEADFCNTGKAGLQKLKEKQYQLVILDVMMPGMDGFETLEKIRKESSLPILMFTSKNDSASKVRGEIFSGIPSFCAAAARLEISLVENRQELHVLPVSYGIEEKLKLPGTKVLMKTGTLLAAQRPDGNIFPGSFLPRSRQDFHDIPAGRPPARLHP